MTEVWFDIGNSCVKAVRYEPQSGMSAVARWSYTKTMMTEIEMYLAASGTVFRIAIAISVGEETARPIVTVCARYCTRLERCISQTEACGVRSGYRTPSALGVDRWLALLGARCLTEKAAMIIDAGTAITCDFLAPSGQHLGGWIVPNSALISSALHSLPTLSHVQMEEDDLVENEYGRATNQAIIGGAERMVHAFMEIEWTQFRALAERNAWVVVCYTTGGGDAARAFAEQQDALYVPELVFFGMACSLGVNETGTMQSKKHNNASS